MNRSINKRLDNLEYRNTKKRVVWVWVDDYKQPTTYTLGNQEITADELATIEADPTVQVIEFIWVEGEPDQ